MIGVIEQFGPSPNQSTYEMRLRYAPAGQVLGLGDLVDVWGPLGPRGVLFRVFSWWQCSAGLLQPQLMHVSGAVNLVAVQDALMHATSLPAHSPVPVAVTYATNARNAQTPLSPFMSAIMGSRQVPDPYEPFPVKAVRCECGAEKALGAKPGQPGHSSWCAAK